MLFPRLTDQDCCATARSIWNRSMQCFRRALAGEPHSKPAATVDTILAYVSVPRGMSDAPNSLYGVVNFGYHTFAQ